MNLAYYIATDKIREVGTTPTYFVNFKISDTIEVCINSQRFVDTTDVQSIKIMTVFKVQGLSKFYFK